MISFRRQLFAHRLRKLADKIAPRPPGFSLTPTAEGLQIEGKDMTPAYVFLLAEDLTKHWVRAERAEDGTIRELVKREGWAWTIAMENLAKADQTP